MIGYNIGKINELLVNIANTYKAIGDELAGGWPNVSDTLGTNWVGPDEVSYEKELAQTLVELYAACKEAITGVVSNVKNVGDTWKTFQSKNVLEGLTANAVNVEVEIPPLTDADVSSIKASERTFDASTNFGLASRDAGNTIMQVITSYSDGITKKVKSLYDEMDAKSAFMGEQQSAKIESWLSTMGEAIVRLTTCINKIKETLTQLTANYIEQENKVVESVGQNAQEAAQTVNAAIQN